MVPWESESCITRFLSPKCNINCVTRESTLKLALPLHPLHVWSFHVSWSPHTPRQVHNRPNGFQTCLGVIDFKMEASQSNLSKTQVEPQRLFWRLWEIFNLLQVKTIGQSQSKGTHIRTASPLGRHLWRSTATVYYNVIKSLRKEDGLAPCCLVEECLPDIPGLVGNPQGYKESYKDMRKYSVNF